MAKVTYEKSKKYKGIRRRVGQKTWNARYSVTLSNGNRATGELTGFTKEKDAFDARTKKIAELKILDETPAKKKTFSAVYKEYYATCVDKAVSTLRKYDSLYENHLCPAFGKLKIAEIKTTDIEMFFQRIGGNVTDKKYGKAIQYSNEYLHGFRKLLANIFKFAYKSEYIKKNPMTCVSNDIYRNMGRDKEEGKYINEDIAAIISKRLETTNLHPSFHIGYFTGMRIGEVFGLLWSDIDFENRIISVNKQLINFKGLWCLAKTKTPAAVRKICISEDLATYLRILKEKQRAEKERCGIRYKENKVGIMINNEECRIADKDLEFVNIKPNGEMLTPASFKAAHIIVKELGYDFSFHDLRTTHITNLINLGTPPDIIKRRMGHEKIETTLSFYKKRTKSDDNYESLIINRMALPDFEKIKDLYSNRTELEDTSYGDDTNGISTEELLGGTFNKRGFIEN